MAWTGDFMSVSYVLTIQDTGVTHNIQWTLFRLVRIIESTYTFQLMHFKIAMKPGGNGHAF